MHEYKYEPYILELLCTVIELAWERNWFECTVERIAAMHGFMNKHPPVEDKNLEYMRVLLII